MERRSFLQAIASIAILTVPVLVFASSPRVTWDDVEATRSRCRVLHFGDHALDVRRKLAHLHSKGAISDSFLEDVVVDGRRTGRTTRSLVVALTFARLGIPTVFMSENRDGQHTAYEKLSLMTLPDVLSKMGLTWGWDPDSRVRSPFGLVDAASGRPMLVFATLAQAQRGDVEWLDHIVWDTDQPYSGYFLGQDLMAERDQAREELRAAFHSAFSLRDPNAALAMLRNKQLYIDRLDQAILTECV